VRSGGSGRDLHDVNSVAESGVGSSKRDVITDFAHLTDDIDVMGIDANTGLAGSSEESCLLVMPAPSSRVP
jgi:hypothetical protein